MSELHRYTIRAGSRAALIAVLDAAQAGKARPFLMQDETGDTQVDASRIRYPYEEMTAGEVDPETGTCLTPPALTGFWLCEVWLEEPDAELAALAVV